MKAELIALSALFLAGTTVAQPHHHRHAHRNNKRAYETIVDVVTIDNPEIVVYVDANGNPLYTKTEYASGYTSPTSSPDPVAVTPEAVSTTPTPAPAPVSSSSSSEVYVPPSSSSTPVYTPPAPSSSSSAAYTPPPPSSSSAAPAPSASAPASSNGGFPLGVSYSPYLVGGCKDAAAVLKDFQAMSEFSVVRLYGTDCNQVSTGLAAAKATNKQLILGVYDVDQLSTELGLMKDAVNGDWSVVKLVSIGNEELHKGKDVGTMVNAINTGRGILRAAGYNGPVSTVDTFDKIIENPSLCQASDIATANCHAFFTSSISASGAGDYVKEQADAIKSACGGKEVLITESGWPWQGDNNGAAKPSKSNQATALASLKSSFSNANIVLFSAFNDAWKQDGAGTFNAEKFWGMLD